VTQCHLHWQERLVFLVGARMFSACPVFSQHSAGDKHKVGGRTHSGTANGHTYTCASHTPPSLCLPFPSPRPLWSFSPSLPLINLIPSLSCDSLLLQYERFFRPGCVTVASVYAPISYPPSPVLVFNDDVTKGGLQLALPCNKSNSPPSTPISAHTDGHIVHTLVATGTVYKVDPYRVICKKIVLSGHPLKIHQKSAVVRYLFFNRGLCVLCGTSSSTEVCVCCAVPLLQQRFVCVV